MANHFSVDCRKFQTCNASICPLDPRWRDAVHLPGEAVCRYLLGTGKAGAKDHYADDPVFESCREWLGEVTDRFPDIARAVQKASRKGFKGRHLKWHHDIVENTASRGE